MLINPFSPGKTVEPEYFAGRKKEIDKFEMFLKSASQGNPMNLAILGERGIGKSSLLRMCEFLCKKQRSISVRIDLDVSVDTITSLIHVILSGIKREGEVNSKLLKLSEGIKNFFQNYQVSIDVLGTKIEARQRKEITSTEFREELSKIWNHIKGTVPAIVIMLDEAEQLENIKGSLQYLRNTFTRLAEEKCGYMLVLSGKLLLFQKLKEIHSPLARFFNPVSLGALSEEESREALDKPLKHSEYDITDEVKEAIIIASQGHPYMIQLFGYYLCEKAVQPLIAQEMYEATLPVILDALAKQLFSDCYNLASPVERHVLKTMAKAKDDKLNSGWLAQKIKKKPSQVSYLLRNLCEKECVKKIDRGQYILFHRLFKDYLNNL